MPRRTFNSRCRAVTISFAGAFVLNPFECYLPAFVQPKSFGAKCFRKFHVMGCNQKSLVAVFPVFKNLLVFFGEMFIYTAESFIEQKNLGLEMSQDGKRESGFHA